MPERRDRSHRKSHSHQRPHMPVNREQVRRDVALEGQQRIPPNAKFKERLLLGGALFTADYFTRRYDFHQTEFLSSYGHDFLGPSIWWLFTQGMFPKVDFLKSKKNIALGVALSYGFEAVQYVSEQRKLSPITFNGNEYRYDPGDLAAYALGAVFALSLYRAIYGNGSTPKKAGK